MILFIQSLDFMVTPLIWYLLAEKPNSDCAKYGSFVIMMPLMGVLLLVCYVWGRYYARKLEFARTIQKLLHESVDEDSNDSAVEENFDY